MRLTEMFIACALLCACSSHAERTPRTNAPHEAAQPVVDAPPRDRLPVDTVPLGYVLDLELDPARSTYGGTVAIELELEAPRDRIWLHGRRLRVSEVRIERADAEVEHGTFEQVGESGLAVIRLKEPVAPGKVRAVLRFEADFGDRLTGLYRTEVAAVHYAFTQFEPISAREAFPCLDEPRFKTPFEVTLRVPKGQVAVGNTRVVAERELEGGLREVRFARTEKLPTYLVALAVGPLDVVPAPPLATSAVRESLVPLRGVSVRGRGPELATALRGTPPLLHFLEGYFGVAYPYDKLDLIAVPDFGAGAMENAGAITFRDTLLLVGDDATEQQRRSLVYVNAHELAHQWFGNLVTMPWWDDIWLNEAFATWMGEKAVSAVHPAYRAELGALTATHGAMEIDSRAAARKIRQPILSEHDIENAFDSITYSKGGAVLSMFERYLGPERFQGGVRAYMERYRFGTATSTDLVRTLAQSAGEPALESAFFTFLDQPGVPELRMEVACGGERPVLSVTQSRYVPLGAPEPQRGAWQIPVCVRFAERDQKAKQQCALVREQKAEIPLEASRCPRWLMPNAGAEGYYRFTLPPPALAALLAHRDELDTREQMSLASNAVAALRAGHLAPEAAMEIQRALLESPERHVVETALRGYWLARELLDGPALAALRAEVSRKLTPRFRKLGLRPRAGEPVGGEQKLWRASVVRALYGLAEDPAVTRGLARAGRELLEGGNAPSRLPSELRELALGAAIREGGAPLFERAVEQLFSSEDGTQRARLLGALSYVRDPALSERALALSLDGRLRLNERMVPLQAQSAMPETRELAFAWLTQHYDALLTQLGAHGGNDIIATTATFCSEEHARQVEAFFDGRSRTVSGGPRELALALESIRACAALADARGAALHALYAKRAQKTPSEETRRARP